MDKSFNDEELSDIMKEIEALEEDFSAEPEDKAESKDSSLEMSDDVMQELAELDEIKSIPHAGHEDNSVLHLNKEIKSSKTSSTSMSFKVQGDLNLELQFDIGGKTVMLEVTESGLNIQMEGGVTFTVPVSHAHSLKKAV